MPDPATITLLAAIISCMISVISLVRSGNKSSAVDGETQGRMLEKMDQVHNAVQKLNEQYVNLSNFNSQSDERFKTLFSDMHSVKERVDRLERK